MTALDWGLVTPPYEFGIDRGIISHQNIVKPWPGLISVDEKEVDDSHLKSYFDGVAYIDQHFGGWFQAVVTAYDFVLGAEDLLGHKAVRPGFFLTRQNPTAHFKFSYRSMIGDVGYKLHFVYNCLITPVKRTNETLNNATDPATRQWVIDTLSPSSSRHKGSAHYIVDSTKVSPEALAELEEMCYGTESTTPSFPQPADLIALFPGG